ncbi:SIMPL domain-containing protein [Pseudosulfitobacter koreensis]|uniref:SIMPL domain-containing protein n=1 Tax=Pseudosulfitobacter koreensis TaxID=2968472 RepID=A0ABT1YZL1_9RHOB|nr:SIMPL domain-containing protein [Pseudosulfitobacter koreense]MCR8826322.1 SIMPL domain-containing protein [Pseudosulfitobacter koreense]
MRNMMMASALALAAMTGGALAQQATIAPPQIEVTGQGEVAVAPDMAVISLGVMHRAPQARDAVQAVNEKMDAILQRLTEQGVDAADVQTSQLTVDADRNQPMRPVESGEAEEKPLQFIANNQVTVRVRDLTELGTILDLVLQDGANQMSGLRFDVQSPAPLEAQARERAVQNAVEQAQQLAAAAGVELGQVRRITAYNNGGRPKMMEMARSSDGVPVASGEVSIDAQVSMVFDIAQ